MPYRILIVDDNKGVSRLLRSALETIDQGLVVSEAPSGEEALLEASRTRMDLLVVDYRLPGITGVELMKKFKAINPRGKVIMISGVADPRILRAITEAGPEAFFAKPVPISDFLKAVASCLALSPSIIETVEPIKPHPVDQVEPSGLSNFLENLRKSTNAQAVLLIDQFGKVLAAAGELAGTLDTSALFSSLTALFSSAQKTARLIGNIDRHVLLIGSDTAQSDNHDEVIFLLVNHAYALFFVGKGIADVRFLTARLELIADARLELLNLLSGAQQLRVNPSDVLGSQRVISKGNIKIAEAAVEPGLAIPAQLSSVDIVDAQSEDLPADFLNIFDKLDGKTSGASSFWDLAVEKGTTFEEPGKLTYEQAAHLGLAPDHDSAQGE